MKLSRINQLHFRFILLALLNVVLLTSGFQNLYAQNTKKNRVRIKTNYVKIMDGESYFDIRATSKVKKENVDVSHVDILVYNEIEDEKIKLGTITTDVKGQSRYTLKSINDIKPDSTNTYNLLFSFKGNDQFKKASKSFSFKDVDIVDAKVITIHGINYITATLSDPNTKNPIADESLGVLVQRLFKSLRIGEEFNNTDENGTIVVPFEEELPGVDGNLTFEIVLNDHDDYGTVKALINAPLGIPVVHESTFDDRTLWSPRNKTPLFILVFANLLILGIWIPVIYLITNLFKINNAKT